MKKTMGILVGSARRESYNGMVARALSDMLSDRFEVKTPAIGGLPLFNQDYDDDGAPPAAWQAFRDEIGGCDAYLFVTPEYNRSIPPVLKNALDVASRPYGQNKWGGKPGAVISASPGKIGGFGANHHLRQVLSFLDVYTMQQPEVYLGEVGDLFDADGNMTNEGTKGFLRSVADAFAGWIANFDK